MTSVLPTGGNPPTSAAGPSRLPIACAGRQRLREAADSRGLPDARLAPDEHETPVAGRGLWTWPDPGALGRTASAYSDRSACNASTRDARAAGMSEAITAAAMRTAAAPAPGSTPGIRAVPR